MVLAAGVTAVVAAAHHRRAAQGQIGRTGVDLLQLMDGQGSSPVRRELDSHLMVRGSTGPAPTTST